MIQHRASYIIIERTFYVAVFISNILLAVCIHIKVMYTNNNVKDIYEDRHVVKRDRICQNWLIPSRIPDESETMKK